MPSCTVANWGSHQFMLWLPRSTLGQKTASRYCVDEEAFSMYHTRVHVLLTFDSDTEKPEDWDGAPAGGYRRWRPTGSVPGLAALCTAGRAEQ